MVYKQPYSLYKYKVFFTITDTGPPLMKKRGRNPNGCSPFLMTGSNPYLVTKWLLSQQPTCRVAL